MLKNFDPMGGVRPPQSSESTLHWPQVGEDAASLSAIPHGRRIRLISSADRAMRPLVLVDMFSGGFGISFRRASTVEFRRST